MNNSNKLIPIITIALIAVLVYMLYSAIAGGDDPVPQQQQTNNSPFNKDGKTPGQVRQEATRDNYLETTRTLAVKQDEYQNKQKELEKKLAMLEQELAKTKGESSSAVSGIASKYDRQIDGLKKTVTKVVDGVSEKLADAKKSAERYGKSKKGGTDSKPDRQTNNNGIPQGLGFDDMPLEGESINFDAGNALARLSMGQSGNESAADAASKVQSRKYVTIKPIYSGVFKEEKGKRNSSIMLSESDIEYKDRSALDFAKIEKDNARSKKKEESIPFYTINPTATLFRNKSLTAMLGVVPQKGVVKDSYRFKVITGATNISSNGHDINHIRNIVWSGTLRGNREMQCVRGTLDTVSLVFMDGTISTTKSADQMNGLGYISDVWGKPCINGRLISNSGQYFRDRLLASGIGSFAEAAAAAEQTQMISPEGNVVNVTDGDSKRFMKAKTVTGMANETAEYIKERQAEAIDIVYVESGTEVVIHVEDEIKFDYDPEGRKLNHVTSHNGNNHYFD